MSICRNCGGIECGDAVVDGCICVSVTHGHTSNHQIFTDSSRAAGLLQAENARLRVALAEAKAQVKKDIVALLDRYEIIDGKIRAEIEAL